MEMLFLAPAENQFLWRRSGFKLGIMPKTKKILLAERKIILIFYIIYFSLVWHCRDIKKTETP